MVTASACAAEVKEYAELLEHDPAYADKAQRVSSLARDLSEVVAAEDCSGLARTGPPRRVAFHSPCTLQHGQKLRGVVEGILERAGFELSAVSDAHLCCGSAGTYSILQPELSRELLSRKIEQPGGRSSGGDRHREHRLLRAPRHRVVGAGPALGPAS